MLSPDFVRPTSSVLTALRAAKHKRPKVPIRKLSPSSEYKNRGTRPRFLWFCKAKPISSSHAAGMTVAHTPCALFPPNLAFGKEGGQACRSRPRKIPRKSPALPDFYAAARAAAARTPLPCRGEGGIVSGFFGTGNVSRGDSVPPETFAKEKSRCKASALWKFYFSGTSSS